MNNADMPAMPVTLPPGESFRGHCPHDGLTKREYIAAMAMQGYIARGSGLLKEQAAEMAVMAADALLDELEKQP